VPAAAASKNALPVSVPGWPVQRLFLCLFLCLLAAGAPSVLGEAQRLFLLPASVPGPPVHGLLMSVLRRIPAPEGEGELSPAPVSRATCRELFRDRFFSLAVGDRYQLLRSRKASQGRHGSWRALTGERGGWCCQWPSFTILAGGGRNEKHGRLRDAGWSVSGARVDEDARENAEDSLGEHNLRLAQPVTNISRLSEVDG
jgi:hypothetical protein